MFSNDWVGKEVVFMDRSRETTKRNFYPKMGTIGVVLMYDCEDGAIFVQWPKGSTMGDDKWWVFPNQNAQLVKDNIENVTNNEIWKMLKPKMEKNNISPIFYGEYYSTKDVHDAVALAYKIGYLRATKGRPFKYSQTKIPNL